MVDKISGTRGAGSSTKTKKSAKKSADAPSFSSLIQQAEASQPAGNLPAAEAAEAAGGDHASTAKYSQSGEERARHLMDNLEELARDILAGKDSQAAGRLKHALENGQVARENLTSEQQQVLDELESRVAAEVAKLEG